MNIIAKDIMKKRSAYLIPYVPLRNMMYNNPEIKERRSIREVHRARARAFCFEKSLGFMTMEENWPVFIISPAER